MAPQQRQKDKLVEVGLEGFALLDEFYGCPKKSGGRLPTTHQGYDHQCQIHRQYHQYNYYNQYQVINIRDREPVINIRDREPVINSDQAAQFYGGRGIVDYSIRTPIRRAY